MAGVASLGQLRRAFLYYVERERARPSSPFLHYNCWYDLGFSVDAEKMLNVVTNFNEELLIKRGVPVQSYLLDDGWDTPGHGLWAENTNKFPGVMLGDRELTGWEMYPFPFDEVTSLKFNATPNASAPAVHRGTFELSKVGDTFLDLRGWGKGIAFVNGHNLGRYWQIGPQQTLYCPGV